MKSIGNNAFSYCTGLASLTIGTSVTSIGDNAFESCSSLTSVSIPNSVTNIGNYSFFECIGLNSITIPNSVKSIGNYAFSGCTSLTSVTIPKSVTSIGDYAFFPCENLKEILSFIKKPFAIDMSVFSNLYFNATLYVLYGTKDNYLATECWNQFKNIVEMEKPVYFIGDLNDDGEVDVTDVVELIDLVLEGE